MDDTSTQLAGDHIKICLCLQVALAVAV